MKDYLQQQSHDANGRDSTWDEDVFDSIAWKPLGEAFSKLTIGQRIQLSKYMNDLLLTLAHLLKFNNQVDG